MTYSDNPEIFKKYNSKRWKKLRTLKLLEYPFCERCLANGLYVPAYIVHHKEYVTDKNYLDDLVFFNIENLESLCIVCHNKEHITGTSRKEYIFDEDGNIIKNPNYVKKVKVI